MPDFLIYGAYGYTGRLVSRLAVDRGLSPILSGRNGAKLEALLRDVGDQRHVAFDLDDRQALESALERVEAVLHCAGPFSRTHEPVARACIRTRTHYLDISGEIPVYQSLAGMDKAARDAGVMLLPGVGFDVVPTDCLAALLKVQLPSATHLALAISSVGPARVSAGTTKTFIEGLARPGLIRKDGDLLPVAHLSDSRTIDFWDRSVKASRIVVADVFSAYYSTGIPNIETYVALPPMVNAALKIARHFGSLVEVGSVQRTIEKLIDFGSAGPTDEDRRDTYTVVWGEVEDDAGNVRTGRIRLPEAYTFTALSCVAAMQRLQSGDVPAGYQTPSSAFGAGFVDEIGTKSGSTDT